MTTPAESIVILDFGSQYTQLIARRIREFNIFSRIVRIDTPAAELAKEKPAGIILSGGPASVYDQNAPTCDPDLFKLGIPILGICYGLQLTVHLLGGKVAPSSEREYGHARLHSTTDGELFQDTPSEQGVWMSHGDKVLGLPEGFVPIAQTDSTPFAAVADPVRRLYGLQFHPEVVHTPAGKTILGNFCRRICGCHGLWTMESFIERSIAEVRQQVGDGQVILGLSGGVDSSVAAALLHRAIGDQLTCIFVDNGLIRIGETEAVRSLFQRALGLNLQVVDASDRFLAKLEGISDPETKRKRIGYEFIAVFEEEAKKFRDARFLAQGTTYPDVIESVSIGGNPSAVIKSHHNVGGLPDRMKMALVEPLRQLFKDEVREVGRQLGLPKDVVWRQPFPGPGLGVRILGPVSRQRLDVLRQADRIVVEEMKKADYYYKVWQSFAVLLPVQSVGVMGDGRTYEDVVALRVVDSQDGMTADWSRLPYDLLGKIANRIINEVRGVNRVCYDISSKPPSTIEWE
jgi:GMP synthase (glutamine-hydrolysing)